MGYKVYPAIVAALAISVGAFLAYPMFGSDPVEDEPAPVAARITVQGHEDLADIQIIQGSKLSFSGANSSGPIDEYEWEFGDGGDDDGASVSYRFDQAGQYEVSLKVSSDEGDVDSTSVFIHVYETYEWTGAVDGGEEDTYVYNVHWNDGNEPVQQAQFIVINVTYARGDGIAGDNDLNLRSYSSDGGQGKDESDGETVEGDTKFEELKFVVQEIATHDGDWNVTVEHENSSDPIDTEIDYQLFVSIYY